MDRSADVDGVPVRVIELTGAAGDVVLTHPWLLHAPSPNAGCAPRFVLSKNVYSTAAGEHLTSADRTGRARPEQGFHAHGIDA